jgi:molybdate transport system substrate-binding protein
MEKLVTAGLVGTTMIFTRNRLEIAVAPGNPKGIHTLADLARSDIAVVLAAPAVPAGNFAKQVLAKANVTVTPKSLELDVKTVLEKVESGDADAAIVYATDVAAAASLVTGVVIPDAQNIIAAYPIAVVKATLNAAAAAAFVTEAVSGLIQKALLKRGFLPP